MPTLETIYMSYVRPLVEYGDIVYDNSPMNLLNRLENIQLQSTRIVTGAKRGTSHALLYREIGWDTLNVRRKLHKLTMFHQMVHKLAPAYLNELIPPALNIRITRQDQANKLRPIHCRHEFYRSSFLPSATNLWNNELNNNQRIIPGKQTFKHAIDKCFSHAKAQNINTI